jgi:hypothetical protein
MLKQLLILLITCLGFSLVAQESVEGRSIKKFTSGKDIHHPINKTAKYKLMQEAVYDAIEKGAAIKISVATYNKVSDGGGDNRQFDQFISTTARQYGVTWQRQSDYVFKLIDKRLWECTVKGIVNRSESSGIDLGVDQVIEEQPTPTITKRGLNKVHISPSTGIYQGQLVGVTKEVKQKVLNDYDFYRKTKALVLINQVESDFAMGKIVKGFYRVKVGDVIASGPYKKNRLGFKLEYSPETKLNPSSSFYSLSFFTDSYVNRWGFNIGADLLLYKADIDRDAGNLFIPHMGASYRLSILPDLLYLIPEFNAGYVVLAESYDAESVMLNPKVYLAVRVKLIELMAGANYKFFLKDHYNQSGVYPFAGVRVNLNKNN